VERAEHPVVWVTGGAGYVGSNLVRALRRAKFFPIVIDDFSTGSRRFVPSYVPLIEHDVSGDILEFKAKLREAVVRYGKPLSIMHLAARTDVGWCEAHPAEAYKINVIGTYNVVEMARFFECPQLVFASSAAVYGDLGKREAKTSMENLSPIGVYGQTKLDAEKMLESYFKTNPLMAAVRIFNISGAGSSPALGINWRGKPDPDSSALIPRMVRNFLSGNQLLMRTRSEFFFNYSPVRDFVHVADVANTLTRLLTVKFMGNWGPDVLKLNLGRCMPVKVHDLLKLTGFDKKELQERVVYTPLNKGEIFYSVAGDYNTTSLGQRTVAQMWESEVRWQKSELYRLIKKDKSKENKNG
jgi:UDP-glucose 4-epimerase